MLQSKATHMPKILNYIHCNFNRKIYLNELAELGKYNPSYFSLLFKEFTGDTLTDYVKKIRMQQAKKMLLETNFSVEQICTTVGYGEKKQFYKLFKYHEGVTPSQFRKSACK